MTPFEEKSHSFVIRIWLEPREFEGVLPEWRASIMNLRTGQKRYFCKFQDMLDFIYPFLEPWGVNPEQTGCGELGESDR